MKIGIDFECVETCTDLASSLHHLVSPCIVFALFLCSFRFWSVKLQMQAIVRYYWQGE
jgi:hypothetical protein